MVSPLFHGLGMLPLLPCQELQLGVRVQLLEHGQDREVPHDPLLAGAGQDLPREAGAEEGDLDVCAEEVLVLPRYSSGSSEELAGSFFAPAMPPVVNGDGMIASNWSPTSFGRRRRTWSVIGTGGSTSIRASARRL